LKIGLNATCLNDRPSGAKQRFAGIYGEVIKRLPEVEFVVYNPVDCRVSDWFAGAPNVTARQTPLPSDGRVRKFLGGLGYWPKAFRSENFDLFEGFNQPLIKAPTGRTILTIHDVRRMHAEWGTWERGVYRFALEKALKSADHLITVSETMKDEILGFFPGVSISVIYNGLDVNGFNALSASDLQFTRQKYNLPQDFLLVVGHYERRKNYHRLIDAIAMLRDRGNACNLVIIGNDSGERKAIEARVASANLSGHVTLLSGLTDHEVRSAYRLARLFVFPSSYEGFGIPILEAMAAGCPMVLSDLPVFREIAQNTGIYFQHDDPEEMASAIECALSADSERTSQIEFGYQRVSDFSFQELAGQLETLYRAMLK
jgi:glycosyltransferase involved in cell wall biosynthesis